MGNIVQKFHNMLDKTLYSRQATFEKFLNLKGSRLDEIGVHSMYYSNHYQPHQLMRNGKEPLHYNILLIIEGEIMIETPFKNQRVHAGEILCFPSTIPRDIYLVSEHAKEIHVRIEEDSRKSLFNFKGLSVHKSDNIDAIFTLLNMCRETKNKKIKNSLFSSLSYYLEEDLTALKTMKNWDNFTKLNHLITKLKEQPEKSWTIDSMAEISNLSKSHFYVKFKEIYEDSPLNVLNQIRMEKAKDILKLTDKSLAKIAEEVGYQSPYSFSNSFSKLFGIRPGAYRDLEKQESSLLN